MTGSGINFIGMQEHPAGHSFALFNTADGHTLSEEGLRLHGLEVPADLVREYLRELAGRHTREALNFADERTTLKHFYQAAAITGALLKEAA